MKIYLVENVEHAPGRIEAIFAHRADAKRFASQCIADTAIVERTLFYGQPPNRDYNK